MPAAVYCQTRQQHDRYRVPRKTLRQTFRPFLVRHLAHGESVEARNGIAHHANICLGRACLLVLPGIAQQETVQFLAAAIEAFNRVIA